ncbi:fumarylacetoacetase [Nocardioides marmoribigeumensis]|uniref:fumarylacetoacetase n=1 Tax=Nocardioides marmoribigeumensis TaxID=433649 RepID=A0ABU2BW69_9ACTN|nr:fumarylacetoacetase [Nocardioides marmoribigeumensis]MDR7362885.1 fumarylacetoacetase [Nocardioides marmoribigeumensis]
MSSATPTAEGPRPSWVDEAAGSGFDVDHLPLGVDPRHGVLARIGPYALPLAVLTTVVEQRAERPVSRDHSDLFAQPTLNPFLAAGPEAWAETRRTLQRTFLDFTAEDTVRPHLVPVEDLDLVLPFEVADYVDFYASLDHASNVGRILRPDSEPLLPNWRHLPVGYHGRAGTVVVSGTDVRRPSGQRKPPHEASPTFGPTRRLDLEAELGFVVGVPSTLGEPVPTSAFADHVFGVVGLNDWSARDIQGWEYVPLGPFLGKSFATSVSAWVTPLAALDGARHPLPGQGEVLDYLAVAEPAGYDIAVEVVLDGEVVARPPYSSMWWSPAQMLAHLTVNGASLRTGDLFASGTISGPERDQRGSFLELSWGGREPFTAGGRERTFLEDGDEVVLRYSAPGERGRITLGEVRGRVLPAL